MAAGVGLLTGKYVQYKVVLKEMLVNVDDLDTNKEIVGTCPSFHQICEKFNKAVSDLNKSKRENFVVKLNLGKLMSQRTIWAMGDGTMGEIGQLLQQYLT